MQSKKETWLKDLINKNRKSKYYNINATIHDFSYRFILVYHLEPHIIFSNITINNHSVNQSIFGNYSKTVMRELGELFIGDRLHFKAQLESFKYKGKTYYKFLQLNYLSLLNHKNKKRQILPASNKRAMTGYLYKKLNLTDSNKSPYLNDDIDKYNQWKQKYPIKQIWKQNGKIKYCQQIIIKKKRKAKKHKQIQIKYVHQYKALQQPLAHFFKYVTDYFGVNKSYKKDNINIFTGCFLILFNFYKCITVIHKKSNSLITLPYRIIGYDYWKILGFNIRNTPLGNILSYWESDNRSQVKLMQILLHRLVHVYKLCNLKVTKTQASNPQYILNPKRLEQCEKHADKYMFYETNINALRDGYDIFFPKDYNVMTLHQYIHSYCDAIPQLFYHHILRQGKQSPKNLVNYVDKLTGRNFEFFTGKLFEILGYSTKVTRQNADYGIDVIAYKGDLSVGIQCKHFSKQKEHEGFKVIGQVTSGLKHYHLDSGLVLDNTTYTKNAFTGAKDCQIALYGRKHLMQLLNQACMRNASALSLELETLLSKQKTSFKKLHEAINKNMTKGAWRNAIKHHQAFQKQHYQKEREIINTVYHLKDDAYGIFCQGHYLEIAKYTYIFLNKFHKKSNLVRECKNSNNIKYVTFRMLANIYDYYQSDAEYIHKRLNRELKRIFDAKLLPKFVKYRAVPNSINKLYASLLAKCAEYALVNIDNRNEKWNQIEHDGWEKWFQRNNAERKKNESIKAERKMDKLDDERMLKENFGTDNISNLFNDF